MVIMSIVSLLYLAPKLAKEIQIEDKATAVAFQQYLLNHSQLDAKTRKELLASIYTVSS